ncbi:MAG: signal peptide peptidase SppA [Pirellulales bacterium]
MMEPNRPVPPAPGQQPPQGPDNPPTSPFTAQMVAPGPVGGPVPYGYPGSPAAGAPPTGGPPAGATHPWPAYPPQPIVIQTRGTFHRILGWIGWAGFLFCGLLLMGYVTTFYEYFNTTEGIYEKYHSGAKFAADKIAIIDISGVIMEGDGFVKRQIDMIREDESVKAVVVRVDSPGGTVTGSDYILHHLKKLRDERGLKLVVSMGSIAASGGYYVSMAVGDEPRSIFAEPTTTTGSIGVIIPHYDISKLMERFDVRDDSIASHPRKQMLSMTRPLSDEDRQIVQSYVMESFERFKEIVKEGRPALRSSDDPLAALATGEIFTAGQAKKHGLVDEIGFIEDAIARVAELAGLDLKKVRVVHYHRPPALFEIPGLAARSQASTHPLSTFLELQAPRAWYLATSWPLLPEAATDSGWSSRP